MMSKTRNILQYNWDDQVEKDEIGGACSTNEEKRNVYRLLWESQREGGH
jgi:hypothetical protein